MSLFDKDRQRNNQSYISPYKTGYFMFMGRWYNNSEEDRGIFAARMVDGIEIVPEDYIESWSGVKQTLGDSEVIYRIYSN